MGSKAPYLAIAGATGQIGSLVTKAASKQGITTIPLSRSSGVDIVSGKGLDEALSSASESPIDAIIDCSDTSNGSQHCERIVPATRTLIAAARKAGIKRYVMLSIVGVETEGLRGYPLYQARYDQELETLKATTSHGGVEGVIVRSVQWFEFAMHPAGTTVTEVDDPYSAGEGGKKQIVQVQDWDMQPAAAAEVAEFLVNTAVSPEDKIPESKVLEIAGPEKMTLPDMTKKYLHAKGDNREVVTVEPALAAFGSGGLCPDEGAFISKSKLGDWLRRGL